jgi:hypothetical protein
MKRLEKICIALLKLALLIFAIPVLVTIWAAFFVPSWGALTVFKCTLLLQCIGFIFMPWWGFLIVSLFIADIFLGD